MLNGKTNKQKKPTSKADNTIGFKDSVFFPPHHKPDVKCCLLLFIILLGIIQCIGRYHSTSKELATQAANACPWYSIK